MSEFYQDDDEKLWRERCAAADSVTALDRALAPTKAVAQHEPGAKLDSGKADASLLQQFPRALLAVAWVGTYGAEKYSRGGWQTVADGIRRYTAALWRHLFAEETEGVYDQDPYYDTPGMEKFKDTVRHDAQVAWNALARLELRLREEEKNGE